MGGAFGSGMDPSIKWFVRISGCDQCNTIKCAIQQGCKVKYGNSRSTGRCYRWNKNGWATPLHECCCGTDGLCPNAPAGWKVKVGCNPRFPDGIAPYPWWELSGISRAVAPDESYIVNESTEHPVENNDLDPLMFEGAIAVLAMVMIAVVVMMTRRWRKQKSMKNKVEEMEMDKVNIDAEENAEEANELLNDHDEHDQN